MGPQVRRVPIAADAAVEPVRVEVPLGERGYPVLVGPGLLDRLGAWVRERLPKAVRAAVITNPRVRRLYGRRVEASLAAAGIEPVALTVPDGERHKTLAAAGRLYDRLAAARLDRASPVVALGGGVVGDLAGFVAATWLRGVPLVQVPTTLLAQVDAAIGGKTGVNHRRGKNLIGAFHQPVLVVSDVETLRTLPEREYRAGLAEVIKYGLIRDAALFAFLEREVERVLAREPAAVTYLVRRSSEIKAEVVAADEREGGLRAVLNFGHTLGHALEALTGYRKYLHGEAVAIGMVAAVRMSEGLLRDDPGARERVEGVLARYGLPTEPPRVRRARLAAALAGDKKARSGAGEPTVTVVLLDRIGSARLEPVRLGTLLSRLGYGPGPEGGSSCVAAHGPAS
ncbi:MAG TPA: 3-dehydroquinate synthase [Thermodesulfobacteriota bacterium]|nr:3-dehydroquinate synthase [Thermodesulfobacteriota bacterium]